MLIGGVPVLDSGPFGESRGAGAHAEACEGPELPPGAAAAEDRGSAEGPANKYVTPLSVHFLHRKRISHCCKCIHDGSLFSWNEVYLKKYIN